MIKTAKQKMTKAEDAFVANFMQQKAAFVENESITKARHNAHKQLQKFGLPSRTIEAWHYTDLRTLLKNVPDFVESKEGKANKALLSDAVVFANFNGKALKAPKHPHINADSIANVLAKNSYKHEKNIADDDFVGQLNTAMLRDGWQITLADDTKLENAIEWQNIQNVGQSHVAFYVQIGKKSTATIVERQIGDNKDSLTSSYTTLNIGDESEINYVIIRDRGFDARQFAKFKANLGHGAKLTLYIVNIASQLNRQEIDMTLQGEGSDFQLRVVNLLSGDSHSDVTMVVRHIVENTTSTEIVRNVVADKARGVFQGMIKVAKEAQKTDARMACNSLILSDDAEFDAKPELEIFADDVACGHGATVAEIDSNHLFYLMARGVPLSEARGLLVKAFVSELIDDVEDEAMQDILVSNIDQWLKSNL